MVSADASSPSPRPLFHQREFVALWWGQLASLTGERVAYLALIALLAAHTSAFRDTSSSWLLSALANVMLAPVLLFAPFVGTWIDRRSRVAVMIGADLLRAAVVLAIPLLYALTHSTTLVFALLFVQFTSGVFFLPAKSALTPEIVAAPQRLQANVWLSAAGVAAAALGSLGGGWLVDHWGWAPALMLNSVTYLLSVASLLTLRHVRSARETPGAREPSGSAAGPSAYLRDMLAGLRVVRDDRHIVLAFTTLAGIWFAGGFLHVAGNLHLQQSSGAPGVSRLGVLIAVLGLGSAVGTLWLNARGRHVARPPLLAGSLVLAGTGVLVFAGTTRIEVHALAAFVMGLAVIPALMVTETMLQEAAAPDVRARVFGTRDFVVRLVLLGSVSVAGGVARAFGARTALVVAGLAAMACGVIALARFNAAGRTPR